MSKQYSLLLDSTLEAYTEGPRENASLYRHVANSMNVDPSDNVAEVGESKQRHNLFHRQVRWAQQSLKQKGLIKKVGFGQWSLTDEGKHSLTRVNVDKHMIAASTDMGVAIWGNSANVFDSVITEDAHLCVTSPPYLGIVRSYGNYMDEDQYIDFLLRIAEPVCRRMKPGASLVLNLTNDSVLRRAFGERSLYLEKLILRLNSKLGLALMDRTVWYAPDKAPKSHQVTKARTHLTSKHEPILWFCNDPSKTFADNRRVLTPYSEQMKRTIERGGEKRGYATRDYDTTSRQGSFSKDNGGSIPGNILQFPTHCQSNRSVLRHARELGLPEHGALYPVALASFLIRWLCPEKGLVIDPFGGYSTTGYAAEMNNRHWITSELHWEYIKPALMRFKQRPGYMVNPLFDELSNGDVRKYFAA